MDQLKLQAALSNMMAQQGGSSTNGASTNGNIVPPSAQAPTSQPQSVLSRNEPSQMGNAGAASGGGMDSLEAMLSRGEQPGDGTSQHHPVAEFLYQLTKMLTDNNDEIIEWVDGRIKVHHPERLEGEVLHKYFRHSKFASFQRQLNYFGFRKIAGKGKMSPCSYVNESATSDIRSLLLIKRKTNGSAARKAMAQQAAFSLQGGLNPALGSGLPGLSGAPGGLGGLGGLGALNQLQMQKQLGAGLLGAPSDIPLSQFLAQNQQQQSWADLQQLGNLGNLGNLKSSMSSMPSIEQLQAQLATLTKQQNQGPAPSATAALNAAGMFGGSGGGGMGQLSQMENPATAALNASGLSSMPATSASQAANAVASQSNNMFESAANLKALLGNESAAADALQAKSGPSGVGGLGSGSLLNRFPSSNGMFGGLTSNASLGNLLASSNRLNSLLSLNSYFSREPSLADLAALMPNQAQLAALQQQQQQNQDLANRLNQHSSS
eukprot:Nitzschia sp. Nitz4//scaffold57_size113557//71910//73385//NITZ4_003999-RA/size113557-processed-gene-0.13-mRNA-1//1//CDS//3329554870//7677//frame0